MGLRYRKSKSFGGVRVTASKSGIGFSTGVKGFRVTKKAGGGYRTTASIPGTGISYVKDYSASSRAATNGSYMVADDPAPIPVDPRIRKCKRGFWWCLGLGIFFTPNSPFIGVPLLGGAIYFFVKKKKVVKEIAAAEASAATEAAAKQQAEIEAQQARIAAIKARAIETASQQQAELEARQARIAAAEAEWQRFLDENQLIRIIHTKVAGVTFRNSDGSSRQENLSYCISGGNVEFEHFTYRGAPAYSVSCGGLQIGNLPADLARDLYELDDSYTFVGEIDEVTGGEDGLKYGCNLRIELYRQK